VAADFVVVRERKDVFAHSSSARRRAIRGDTATLRVARIALVAADFVVVRERKGVFAHSSSARRRAFRDFPATGAISGRGAHTTDQTCRTPGTVGADR
jgi:hypothetical protein